MKVKEIVDKVSVVYREERGKEVDLQAEWRDVSDKLEEAKRAQYKNITVAEYNNLMNKKELLALQIKLQKQYCEGISCVREMLMDLGFYTDVTL